MPKDPRIGGKTVNDILLDLALEHQVSIERLKSSEVKKALDLLAELDEELLAKINARVARLGPVEKQLFGAGRFTTERLERLRRALREVADRSYDLLIGRMRETLDGAARQVAEFERQSLQKTISPVIKGSFETATVSGNQLRSVVRQTPIEGQVLAPFVREWSRRKRDAVAQEIRKGVVAAETVDQITQRVKRLALLPARARVETIVRTATQAITSAAREEVWRANERVIKKIRWTATLDTRTCVICASLDGKLFDLDEGRRPPAHPNCRCVTVAVTTASNVPGERASAFGPVPKDITFEEFLKQRGAAFQDDVLGPTKAKLFRQGKLKLNDFVDKSGRPFDLDDLARRFGEAFRRAGLDPGDFRDAA